jgi:hypothetical protein
MIFSALKGLFLPAVNVLAEPPKRALSRRGFFSFCTAGTIAASTAGAWTGGPNNLLTAGLRREFALVYADRVTWSAGAGVWLPSSGITEWVDP